MKAPLTPSGNRNGLALARAGLSLLFCLLLATPVSFADSPPDPDAITGTWAVAEKDAHIEIYRDDDAYSGRISWLREDGKPSKGAPRESDMYEVPKVGLVIVRNFRFDGKEYTGGRLYNPTDGRSYRGVLTLVAPDELHVRGFLLIRLLGRTTVWRRVR